MNANNSVQKILWHIASSNIDMQRRMLRYFLSLYWKEDLPIMQALVLLKEPGVKSISNGTENYVFGEEVFNHRYDEPLIEHLKECLDVAETMGDPDFYFKFMSNRPDYSTDFSGLVPQIKV